MQIETTHHIDASDMNADGTYDYFYEYDLYRLSDSAISIVARSYTGEPQKAHFLRIEKDGNAGRLKAEDLQLALFVQAVNYLRGIGKEELSWLSALGYEPLAPTT